MTARERSPTNVPADTRATGRPPVKVPSPVTTLAPPAQAELLRLQRLAGNRAVTHLAHRSGASECDGGVAPVAVQRGLFDWIFGSKKAPAGNAGGGAGDGRGGAVAVAAPPQDMLKAAFDAAVSAPTTIAAVRPSYERASLDDRKRIWQDDALMGKCRANLSDPDFTKLVVELGVMRTGGVVAHTSAKEADDAIRDKLKRHVGDAVKAGRAVQGSMAVLDGDDWVKSYYHEFPNELPRGGPTDDEPTTRAFTTTNPPVNVIIVHKDRGNPGTVVHEGMHLYQNDAVLNTCGNDFNEGITELLTRKVTGALGIERDGYENNLSAMRALKAAVGEGVLADAYFNGSVEALEDAFVAYRMAKGDDKAAAKRAWRALVDHFNNEHWRKAKGLFR